MKKATLRFSLSVMMIAMTAGSLAAQKCDTSAFTFNPATRKYTMPVGLNSVTSQSQCSCLQQQWDALKAQVDAQHEACLSAGKGKNNSSNASSSNTKTCDVPSCQNLHDLLYTTIGDKETAQVSGCNQAATKYESALQAAQKEQAQRDTQAEALQQFYEEQRSQQYDDQRQQVAAKLQSQQNTLHMINAGTQLLQKLGIHGLSGNEASTAVASYEPGRGPDSVADTQPNGSVQNASGNLIPAGGSDPTNTPVPADAINSSNSKVQEDLPTMQLLQQMAVDSKPGVDVAGPGAGALLSAKESTEAHEEEEGLKTVTVVPPQLPPGTVLMRRIPSPEEVAASQGPVIQSAPETTDLPDVEKGFPGLSTSNTPLDISHHDQEQAKKKTEDLVDDVIDHAAHDKLGIHTSFDSIIKEGAAAGSEKLGEATSKEVPTWASNALEKTIPAFIESDLLAAILGGGSVLLDSEPTASSALTTPSSFNTMQSAVLNLRRVSNGETSFFADRDLAQACNRLEMTFGQTRFGLNATQQQQVQSLIKLCGQQSAPQQPSPPPQPVIQIPLP